MRETCLLVHAHLRRRGQRLVIRTGQGRVRRVAAIVAGQPPGIDAAVNKPERRRAMRILHRRAGRRVVAIACAGFAGKPFHVVIIVGQQIAIALAHCRGWFAKIQHQRGLVLADEIIERFAAPEGQFGGAAGQHERDHGQAAQAVSGRSEKPPLHHRQHVS